jgi:hypothetical protein
MNKLTHVKNDVTKCVPVIMPYPVTEYDLGLEEQYKITTVLVDFGINNTFYIDILY